MLTDALGQLRHERPNEWLRCLETLGMDRDDWVKIEASGVVSFEDVNQIVRTLNTTFPEIEEASRSVSNAVMALLALEPTECWAKACATENEVIEELYEGSGWPHRIDHLGGIANVLEVSVETVQIMMFGLPVDQATYIWDPVSSPNPDFCKTALVDSVWP